MASDRSSRKARKQTDATLRIERDRSDEELLGRSTALREDADELIQRARERAREILALARREQDASLVQQGASDAARATVTRERKTEDELDRLEHATADAALRQDREKRRRALLHLLELERTETDSMLGVERLVADRMIARRDDMLGVVSHDLRAQLSVLLLKAAAIIDEHPENPRLVRDADVMLRTIAQMSALVGDLLDVASADADRLRIERVRTDLVAIVTEELEVHRVAAEARSLHLSLQSRDPTIFADVDPTRMRRVVMNLLTNAIKFTPAGGRIAVQIDRAGDDIELSVRDTGPGIAPDQLEAVFERFRQVGAEHRRSGHGLGLYIARAIIAAHGGRIWAEGTQGQGATFRVRLPLKGATRGSGTQPSVAS